MLTTNLFATTLLALAIPGARGQGSPQFPVVGIGPGQWIRLRAIALAADSGACQALLSFRDIANAAIGPSRQVDLAAGKSDVLEYIPSLPSRIEIRPVV